MQLNSEIWGTEEQQTRAVGGWNVDTYEVLTTTLTTADTLGHYKEAHGTAEPIDNSVNYWQLWDKSPFNKMLFIRKDGSNNHIYTLVKSIKPKSIFITYRTSTITDVNFDINSQYTHLWEPNIAYPNSSVPYSNYGDIVTKFNYNKIGARFTFDVYLRDENGNPTSGAVPNEYKSIYGFFNSVEDGVPVKDKYIITGLRVDIFPLTGNGGNAYGTNAVLHHVSSTPVETPQPNYYYQSADFITYTRGTSIIGGGISGAGGYGYQIGAYGQSNHAPYWGFDPDNHWELKNFINANNQYIEFFEFTGAYEDMLSQCASLGFWFREDLQPGSTISENLYPMVTGENCDDDRMIMPIIENGQTTGRYLRGTAAGRSSQAQWGANWRDNVGYTGDKPYKSDASDRGDLTSVFHRASLGGSLNYYLFSPTELQNLVININSGYQPTTQEQFTIDFKGTNPADYIANVLYFPDGFVCPKVDSTTFTNVKIGAVTFTFPVGVEKANVEAGYYKEFAPIPVSPEYYSFMDYAPYTTISLYIPFCGTVDLDPSIYMGHTVTVRLYIDYLTGSCTGVVLRDGLATDTISGSCGVSIPLTALATGSYQNAIKQAEIAVKQAEIQRKTAWLGAMGAAGTLVGGLVTANPLAIAGGIVGSIGAANAIESANLTKESAVYNLDHTAPAVENVSTASPANAIGLDYDVHMLIKRPLYLTGFSSDIYGHTVGNACMINAPLSSFSGLTVCADADLTGITAPAEVKSALLRALQSGVYI